MNTPAHLMLNLGLLGRGKSPSHQLWVLAGAMMPDVPLLFFYVWEKVLKGVPESRIWEHYFDERWQGVFDVFHSFPVAILGGVLSMWVKWKGLALFWTSMALHSLGDLPFHHDDAHRHFFPFSDWQYASPVSYWDPRFHGEIFTIVEILMVIGVGLWMWHGATWGGTKVIVGSIFAMYLGYLGYVVVVWM
ncbi:MAG: hypothetical protein V3T42_10860 [Nitrospirales bacterium]